MGLVLRALLQVQLPIDAPPRDCGYSPELARAIRESVLIQQGNSGQSRVYLVIEGGNLLRLLIDPTSDEALEAMRPADSIDESARDLQPDALAQEDKVEPLLAFWVVYKHDESRRFKDEDHGSTSLPNDLAVRGGDTDAISLSADLIWGIKGIAAFIGKTERQTFHLTASEQIPTAKVGGRIVASRRIHSRALCRVVQRCDFMWSSGKLGRGIPDLASDLFASAEHTGDNQSSSTFKTEAHFPCWKERRFIWSPGLDLGTDVDSSAIGR